MSSIRRYVQRTEPPREESFDQQFWPIAVATIVMGGFLLGAIVTLAHEAWMWGLLLSLPAAIAASILVLWIVPNRWVRRSLQLAIVISLIANICFVIVAAKLDIFQRLAIDVENPPVQRKKTESINISVRTEERPWEELNETENEHNDQSPDVNRTANQATSPWQAQPTKSTNSENQTPQVVRRQLNQTSRPKLGKSPSKLSRRDRQVKPNSSQTPAATAASASAKTSSPENQQTNDSVEINRRNRKNENQPKPSEEAKTQSASASPVRRQSEPQKSESPAATASNIRRTNRTPSAATLSSNTQTAATSSRSSSNVEAQKTEVQRQSSAAKLTTSQNQQAKASNSSAQRRTNSQSSTNNSPTQIKRSAVASRSLSPATTRPSANTQKRANNNLSAKQATVVKRTQAAPTNPKSQRNQSDRVAAKTAQRQMNRRSATQTPTLDNPRANEAPRRARTTADVASSPAKTESPTHTVKNTPSKEQGKAEAQAIALTRANQGVTGQGSSANLSNSNSSERSPAKVASDSFARSRSRNNNNPESLNSSQAALTPRSIAGKTRASSVLKQQSSTRSIYSGQMTPQESTANASASLTESTSKRSSDSSAVESGTASADVGPTKIVMEANIERASSGGGRPESSMTGQPRPLTRSGKTSSSASIAAANPSNRPAAEFAAGHEAPSSESSEASEQSAIAQRQSNNESSSISPSNRSSDSEPASADSDSSNSLARAEGDEEEDEDEENNQPGQLARNNPRAGSNPTSPASPDNSQAIASNDAQGNESGEPGSADTTLERSSTTANQLANSASGDSGQAELNHDESASTSTRADSRSAAPNTESNQPGNIGRRSGPSVAASQSPNSGTSQQTTAQNNGTNSPTKGVESRALNAARVAAKSLPGSSISNAAASAIGMAATALPLVQSSNRRSSNDPSINGEGSDQPSNLGRNRAGSPSRVASRSPNSTNNQNRGIADNANGQSNTGDSPNSAAEFSVAKRKTEGMALDVSAPEGPAGLGETLDEDPGVNRRNASPREDALESLVESRFRKKRPGGRKALSPARIKANMAFRSRRPAAFRNASPRTTEYIDKGLDFLARSQQVDGSWSLTQYDQDRRIYGVQGGGNATRLDSDTAATGLAVLAFQGAGYNHREYKYARQLDKAIQWLIENQQDDGLLYTSTQRASDDYCKLYSHGIAAIALTEAYGMTQDPALKEPVERAINYIVLNQDPEYGGWRYKPGKGTDTSVSGWMVMALHSARLAGIEFDDSVWTGVDNWLDQARHPVFKHQFRYRPQAKDTINDKRDHHRKVSHSMTAVALLMKLYTGWTREQTEMQLGADYLLTKLPSDKSMIHRDTYYWYYATQVMAHVGGDRWKIWNHELEELLTKTQVKAGPLAGSWDPYRPVADRWGHQAGRIYVTTMNLLSLEVRHRMLPIYDDIVNQKIIPNPSKK